MRKSCSGLRSAPGFPGHQESEREAGRREERVILDLGLAEKDGRAGKEVEDLGGSRKGRGDGRSQRRSEGYETFTMGGGSC